MALLEKMRAANAVLVQEQPLVAVFFSTGGIVHQTVRALSNASTTCAGRGFRAYLIGRKAEPAQKIIKDCQTVFPEGKITFIQVKNLALLRDVDEACRQITTLEEQQGDGPRIDYLLFGQGGSIFLPRRDTIEGIDQTMALMFYSRARATQQLLPLLEKSRVPSGATVVSVYAAGMEKRLYMDDLSLRDPKHYSYSQARSHMCYMHTLFFESLVGKASGKTSLVHIFPGLVIGPGFENPELPSWFRLVFNKFFVPVFGRFVTVKPEVCGQTMLFLASAQYPAKSWRLPAGTQASDVPVLGTDGEAGSGAYCLDQNGESAYPPKSYAKIDKTVSKGLIWKHVMDAFSAIEAGKPFDR